MNPNNIGDLLESIGPALRSNRERVAAVFYNNPKLTADLITHIFKIDYKLHHKAAWILEILLENDIEILVPHIDYFSSNIRKLTHQSAIRPISKICNWLAISYVKKEKQTFLKQISIKNLEQITEAGFDWMIGNTKVATKAYTMNTLFLLGKLKYPEFQWIHKELKSIIQQNIHKETAAYKSRGIITLKLLEKETLNRA